jgi:4-amino-4-deoxy-L-arabinose transferase-like glycosyltransferase
LWDDDEGNNAEAAREMLEAGDLVVPTFNYELRVDKPALLYWLQMGAYRVLGVSDHAARVPCALAALGTVLLTYELARLMFDREVGLLAGLILSTAAMFYSSGHFANPDALLCLLTVFTFLVFWRGLSSNTQKWFIPAGLGSGLAVLAKGPIGILLPAAVIGLFLFLTRQLHRLREWRLLGGLLAFAIVALPWYTLVTVETDGAFLSGFLMRHNVYRFFHVMEDHDGPVYYYLVVLLLGFAPWSAFLGPALYFVSRQSNRKEEPSAQACVLLGCWMAVYLLFFTLCQSKLPNYLRPLDPAAAIITGYFLMCYVRGKAAFPRWIKALSFGCVAAMGIGLIMAGWVLSDEGIDLWFLRGHRYPGLGMVGLLGAILAGGALLAWWLASRTSAWTAAVTLVVTAVICDDGLTAWDAAVLDHYKSPRPLALAIKEHAISTGFHVACYEYFQPSLVFYLQRKVSRLRSDDEAVQFLSMTSEAYVMMPLGTWERIKMRVAGAPQLLAIHYDFVDQFKDVVAVTNRSPDILSPPARAPVVVTRPSSGWEAAVGNGAYLALFGFYASGP